MDLAQVKSILIPEGEVKKIQIGNNTIWERPVLASFIKINESNEQPITDFVYYQEASKTFTADYNIPAEYLAANNIQWEVENLPAGLDFTADGATLTISGYSTDTSSKSVTITVTIGEYTDSKIYEFAYQGNSIIPTIFVSENTDSVSLPYGLLVFSDAEYKVYYITTSNPAAFTDKEYKLVSGSYPSCLTANMTEMTGQTKRIYMRGKRDDNGLTEETGSITIQARCLYNGKWNVSELKTINWVICNLKLRKKYSGSIKIDITKLQRESSVGSYSFDITDWIAPLSYTYGGIITGMYFGSSSTGMSSSTNLSTTLTSYTNIQFATLKRGDKEILLLTLESRSNKYTSTSSNTLTRYLNLKNAYGTVSVQVQFFTETKANYEANINTLYATAEPIFTYPTSTNF